jgi:ATP-dependent Clp protease adapter protein ClpS
MTIFETPVQFYTTRKFPPRRFRDPDEQKDSPKQDELFEVRIIDNDYNTYQEVMDVSMLALGITEEEAYAVAWEVDHLGSCVVAQASLETAEAIASVIRTIGIDVQVNPLGPQKL